ncbi:MAG: lysylphosphatidylglycerol synthase transmembrane domain-containing protein, partial [Pirellulales bacterium]
MNDAPEPPPARRRIPAWLGVTARVAATVGLMAYAFRDIDWNGLGNLLAAAHWGWWLAALATTLLVQVVAGIRWAALARPLGFDFPRRFFVRRFFEGMFFSLCLPSSIGGDVVKAVRIGSTTPLRLLAACSVLADRLTGLAALGVLVGTAIITRKYTLGTAAAVAVFAGLLAAAVAGFRIVLGLLDRIHAILPEGSPGRDFVTRLLPYRQRPSLVLGAIGWSFVVQIGGAVAVGFVARALGVVEPLATWFIVVPLVALLMVLPISIGGFGVRENALGFLLRGYGVPTETGVAIALLWGLCTIIAGLVGGGLFLLERRPLEVAAPRAPPPGH